MLWRTHLQLARSSIKQNRTRSLLTCLGIAIGVASIVLILSLTGSITRLIQEQTREIGEDLIVVRPNSTKDVLTGVVEELTASSSYQKSNLVIGDVETIKKIDGVAAAAPVALAVNTVTTDKNTVESALILGTNEDFNKIENLTMKSGVFIDDENSKNTVVIGHMLALYLFNNDNPVGKTLSVMGERFIVTGVLSETENSFNFSNVDYDNALMMNIQRLDEVSGTTQIQQINVKAVDVESVATVSQEIEGALKESKSGDQNFTVAYGDQITHPASSLFMVVSGILELVAGISLVVGGIGVMNIMLVSVAERNSEIGIRKAIGASSQNILLQFLMESLILSLMGGAIGLLLGYIAAFFVSIITPFAPFISWGIIGVVLLTILIIGVLFGIYPAIKAARKNPIESLKRYR